MKTGNAPQPPRCTLAAMIQEPRNLEDIKAMGWNEQRILVVAADDARLGWFERSVVEQIGEKLYGGRHG